MGCQSIYEGQRQSITWRTGINDVARDDQGPARLRAYNAAVGGTSLDKGKPLPKKSRQKRALKKAGKRPAKTFGRNKGKR